MKPSLKKFFVISTLIVILGLSGFVYLKFYFVLGRGVKAGHLNYIVHKGYIFKTYEGKLIQSGFRGTQGSSAIQSYEFTFSVESKEVADSLMRSGGDMVEVHYKEYKGALPWRGMSTFVVDSILSIR